MVLFNYSTKELTAKIVYYGPGLCGKTTNLQFIHENLSPNVKGKMLSLATKTDRTLFFDFLPMDLGEIRGMKTRMQLYTVPGQVFYNETRKLVLKGVDGIVFVADSQKEMLGPNIESFKNLEENLKGHGYKLSEMPHVIQFNKRDLPKLASVEELNAAINKFNAPFYETVATTGIGVQDSLKAITKLVLLHLTKKYDPRTGAAKTPAAISTPAPAERPRTSAIPVAESADVPVAQPIPVPVPVAVASGSVDATSALPMSDGGNGASLERDVALSVDDVPLLETPGPETTGPAPKADFAADEIDGLMGEVQDLPDDSPTLAAAEEQTGGSLEETDDVPEVQLDADATADDADATADDADATADDTDATAGDTDSDSHFNAAEERPRIEVNVEAVPGEESTPELSQVLSEADLFQDPSLEIAHLAAGQQREIVIPVQIAGAGESFKRYKLSLRLKLDALD